ncbi:unnamed protein product [Caenorhabditis nigoni]
MNRRKVQNAVEEYDETYEYEMDLYNFDQALMKMESLKNICSGTTKNQRILHCKRIQKHLQEILKPTAPINYDAMLLDRQKMQDAVERFDENCEYKRHLYNLEQACLEMRQIGYRYSRTCKPDRIYYCTKANEHIEAILKPKAPIDYDAMPYEKLLERYNFIKEKKAREQLFSWKPLINMCNSVKTACTESYESMKKKIGKHREKQ